MGKGEEVKIGKNIEIEKEEDVRKYSDNEIKLLKG